MKAICDHCGDIHWWSSRGKYCLACKREGQWTTIVPEGKMLVTDERPATEGREGE